jgi:hypothetical protein
MNRFLTPRRLALAAVLALGAVAALTGCAKKVTTVDAGYTTLEGRPNANSMLFAWQDSPTLVTIYTDLGTPGPSPDPDNEPDTVLTVEPNYDIGPGVVHLELLDGTQANGFQFYRRSSNGGLESLTDYVLGPVAKWLSTDWELYSFSDRTPGSWSPPTYVGRGLLGGAVTTSSPLSNIVQINPVRPTPTIVFDDVVHASRTPSDSLFPMSWNSIPGAAGYWIDVYQWKAIATVEEKLRSGTPSPVWPGNANHYFVGYVAGAGNTVYKLGSPGATVYTFKPPIRGQVYYARITAVDAAGNVIAWMKGDQLYQLGDGTYRYIPLAAVAINPK